MKRNEHMTEREWKDICHYVGESLSWVACHTSSDGAYTLSVLMLACQEDEEERGALLKRLKEWGGNRFCFSYKQQDCQQAIVAVYPQALVDEVERLLVVFREDLLASAVYLKGGNTAARCLERVDEFDAIRASLCGGGADLDRIFQWGEAMQQKVLPVCMEGHQSLAMLVGLLTL